MQKVLTTRSAIDLFFSARGGEGAFEEVKGGEKQVGDISFYTILRQIMSRQFCPDTSILQFTIIPIVLFFLSPLLFQGSVRSTESKALTLGNKFDVLGAE